MKIGIYDVDSKIPNLALMKLSAFHKDSGDDVEMYSPLLDSHYDQVYASIIFNFSNTSYLNDRMIVGGTGSGNNGVLDPKVERTVPDYSLYDCKHSIGFTMRGCRFKCDFCVVPKKEGRPQSNNTIEEIWTQRDNNFVMLLDNDFFGNPYWRERIAEMKKHDLRVNFSQGLNIRIISKEQAESLKTIKFRSAHNTKRRVFFAWDQIKDEKVIWRGIHRVVEAGIKPHEMEFYILIGFDSTHEENLRRVGMLRDFGCSPYAMPYNKSDPYQRHFTRWVNHKAVFKSVSWKDYIGERILKCSEK